MGPCPRPTLPLLIAAVVSTGAGAVASATAAAAQGVWVPVYSDGAITVTLDTSRIEREGAGTFSAYERWRFADPPALESGERYDWARVHQWFDCGNGQMRPVSAAYYAGTRRVALKAFTTEAGPPAPGSIGEAKLVEVCRVVAGAPPRVEGRGGAP